MASYSRSYCQITCRIHGIASGTRFETLPGTAIRIYRRLPHAGGRLRARNFVSTGLTRQEYRSAYDERYDTVVAYPGLDVVASHRLNDRPFLPKKSRRLVHVRGVYLDTTGPPPTLVRNLKEEAVANRLPVAINRRLFTSHSASP